MSEMLIDHPIVFIEKLLKLGLGDKGRLLYLRNYIKSGKTIYDSDKKFLETLQTKFDELESYKKDESIDNFMQNNEFKNAKFLSEYDYNVAEIGEKYSIDKNESLSEFDPEISKIQNSICDLQKSNSRLKDSLELILISRENISTNSIKKLIQPVSSSNNIENNFLNSISSIKKNSNSTNLKMFGVKKHDMMAYASAGLFTLWYAGYQNIIDMGPFQSISLGLSIASAVSAGIFYRRQKTSWK